MIKALETRFAAVLLVAGSFASLSARSSPAQCLSWDVDHGSSAPHGLLASFVADVGSGPELLLGSTNTGVLHWNGTGWVPLGTGSPQLTDAFALFDDGTGTALYAAGSSITKWTGTSWVPVGSGMNGQIHALVVHDDGGGPRLVAGGSFTTADGHPAIGCAKWNGSGWSGFPSTTTFYPSTLCSISSGPLAGLYAGGGSYADGPMTRIAKWNGTSWVAVGSGAPTDFIGIQTLVAFDSGSGLALYAGGYDGLTTYPLSWPALLKWNGSNWSSLTAELTDVSGNFGSVDALQVLDDGSGKALFVGGDLQSSVAFLGFDLLRYDGATWSSAAGGLSSGSGSIVSSLSAWDDGTGHGPSLAVAGTFTSAGGLPTSNFAVLHGCRIHSFCAGDGVDPAVTTACPCGNFGAAGHGCAWSSGPSGALLAASGAISPADGLVLSASGMPPTSTAVFFRGSALAAGGVVFGDGVRCVGGNLVRLGAKTAVGGVATYPEAADPSISVRGMTPVGSGITAFYQTAYRNAATFCTSATSNSTNAMQVIW